MNGRPSPRPTARGCRSKSLGLHLEPTATAGRVARSHWRAWLFSLVIGFFTMLPAQAQEAPGMDPDTFARELERAAALNVSEPWRVSQAVLDRLRPHLALASAEQYARFKLLEIRNLGLAGRLDAALDQLHALLERDMTQRQRLRAYTLGANIGMVARRYRITFSYLNQARAMLEDDSLRRYGDDIYALAAQIYAQVAEHDRAEEYGRLAVATARDREPRDLCIARARLASAYMEAEDWARSRREYETALNECRAASDPLAIAVVEYRLADLLRRDRQFERAESLFERALSGMQEVGYEFGLAEARLFYARLARDLGRSERVESLLEPALEQLREDRNWQYYAEAQRLLAEVARSSGRLNEMLERYDHYLAARERFLEIAYDRQTAFLEVRFDTEHTEQQLQLMREQQRVRELQQTARVQQRRLQVGVYGLLALLVAVLTLLLIRATRDRRRYQSLSQRDALTALSNHTRFFELAEKTLELSREKNISFVLVLADIDRFKRVNDEQGHPVGDQVLRRVAARMREQFSDNGIIGRIGGEEFAIALPGLSLDQVDRRLHALRRSLGRMREDDLPVAVTMSFGVVSPEPHESLTAARSRADRALYEAKRAGRDRIVHADER
jgi:diguanylate cyclase (GGDEF)-like protein